MRNDINVPPLSRPDLRSAPRRPSRQVPAPCLAVRADWVLRDAAFRAWQMVARKAKGLESKEQPAMIVLPPAMGWPGIKPEFGKFVKAG